MPVKKKKARQTGAKTSARLAPLSYVIGVVALTLGIAFLLSMITTVDSTVMTLLRGTLTGLCGKLYGFLPFLMLWLGAALITHAYHGVSGRNMALALGLYLALLALISMITFVSGKGNLLEYIYAVNQQKLAAAPASMPAFMQRLYLWGSEGKMQLCGGGALSMLFAYPAYRLFGVIGGIIFLSVLLIVLFLSLTRIHVIELFRKLSDTMEKRRLSRAQKRPQQPAPGPEAPPVSPLPVAEPRGGQRVEIETTCETERPQPVAYEQPARQIQPENSSPNAAPYYYPQADPYPAPDGFYPVNNGNTLYDERFVLHPEQQNRVEPAAPADALPPQNVIPARENAPSAFAFDERRASRMERRKNMEREAASGEQASGVPAQTEQMQPAPERVPTPMPEPEKHMKPDDTPPWEEPAEKKDSLSDWQAQLKRKQDELNGAKTATYSHEAAKPLSERGPRQVFTDPAVPLTGERVQITPSASSSREDARLDGTPRAPRIKQMEMPMMLSYSSPPMRFLTEGQAVLVHSDTSQEDTLRAQQIERTLSTFNISAQIREITHGPAITRFALKIAEGIKVRQVVGVLDNIALEMGSDRVRVEAPIPGTSYIGIEVPNSKVSPVMLREVLDSDEMRKNTSPLVVALGKDIAGKPILCDLSKMPHLLIAGATGSGKSVCINSIICSLLYRASPAQVRLIMVDPKQVELQVYNGIPHLLVPVVSDPKKAASALNWVVTEMFERYGKFSAKSVRNLDGYNKKMDGTDEILPHIVVVIDEMADLMDACRKDVEESVRRLAALARAAGIYMVLATQRPSVDVITGVIKNNIPSRIAFTVSSGVDSRTIIDINGAEKLMGKGDMLYQPTGASKPTRVQGCFVSDDEVTAITDYIHSRYQTDYDPNVLEHMDKQEETSQDDPMDDDGGVEPTDGEFNDLLKQAIRMAVEDGQSSISMLQRRLRVGYARAGRLIDEMAKRGIITESEGSKPRKTKITREQYMDLMKDDEK